MSDRLKEIEARTIQTMPLTKREDDSLPLPIPGEVAPYYVASFEVVEDMRWLIEDIKRLRLFFTGEYICPKCFFRNREGEKPEADF